MIAIGVGVIVVLAVARPLIFNSNAQTEEATEADAAAAPMYPLGEPDAEGWREVQVADGAPADSSLIWSWDGEACTHAGDAVTIGSAGSDCTMSRALIPDGESSFRMTARVEPSGGESTEADVGTYFGSVDGVGDQRCWVGVNSKRGEYEVACEVMQADSSLKEAKLVDWQPSAHIDPNTNTIRVDLLAQRFTISINGTLLLTNELVRPMVNSFSPYVSQRGTATGHDTFSIGNVSVFTRESPAALADTTAMR
jgi:hypothetical protein